MMLRQVLFVALLAMAACNNDKKKEEPVLEEVKQILGVPFTEMPLPYQLSDTALAKTLTATISPDLVSPLLADSIKNFFGKNASPKYYPLGKVTHKGAETYYILSATAGTKKGAVLLVYDAEQQFAASYPFLLVDANAASTQTASIDKNFSITRTISLRNDADVAGEGKEVIAYDAATKSFSLIMRDALADNPAELVNPIDTLRKTHPLSGDYYLNKKNLIAVRDGRSASELTVYIHTEDENAACIGQLKGEFILTSSTTAAYRQGGDPCVLSLSFKNNTVTMQEERGCGNYRGLDCPLSGTFRKKLQSAKPLPNKTKRR